MRKSRHIEEKTHGVEVEGDGSGRFWRVVGKMGFRSWGSIIALISL
jgi:hypothetical protein